MSFPVIQKVFPNPMIDGVQRHPVAIFSHRHAYQSGVREWRFFVTVLLVESNVDG